MSPRPTRKFRTPASPAYFPFSVSLGLMPPSLCPGAAVPGTGLPPLRWVVRRQGWQPRLPRARLRHILQASQLSLSATRLMRLTRVPVQDLKTALSIFPSRRWLGSRAFRMLCLKPEHSASCKGRVLPVHIRHTKLTLNHLSLHSKCYRGSKDLPGTGKIKSGRVGSHPALSAVA